ncbi:MAG: carboxymuconolactone decarboxylase family protein [Hyphomicrobiales bacterium]|nr:carboxymuconolactone decarboxylase family protein [Hyphomicrobiales bacterium]
MSRLLDLTPDQLTAEQKQIFERLVAGRGRILGPYRAWIHSPVIASAMEQIGTHLNKRSTLSAREVEMVTIMIARHWQGEYVHAAHVKLGREAGLSQAVIEALDAGREPPLSDPHEQAVHRLAAAMIACRKVSDAEFAAVEKVLGRAGIAEVLVLIGYYSAVSMAMRLHEVPIPA